MVEPDTPDAAKTVPRERLTMVCVANVAEALTSVFTVMVTGSRFARAVSETVDTRIECDGDNAGMRSREAQ